MTARRPGHWLNVATGVALYGALALVVVAVALQLVLG